MCVRYGQSRDLVFRLVNVPAEGAYVTVSVQHDLGSSEQPHKITADGVDVRSHLVTKFLTLI